MPGKPELLTEAAWEVLKSGLAYRKKDRPHSAGELVRHLEAAQALTKTEEVQLVHFGETISIDRANYNGNYTYAGGPKGEYRGKTVEVGRFPANAWGLHDVHGNVWEWTCSVYNENYEGAEQECVSKDHAGRPGRPRRFSPRQVFLTLCSFYFYPLRGPGAKPLVTHYLGDFQ